MARMNAALALPIGTLRHLCSGRADRVRLVTSIAYQQPGSASRPRWAELTRVRRGSTYQPSDGDACDGKSWTYRRPASRF